MANDSTLFLVFIVILVVAVGFCRFRNNQERLCNFPSREGVCFPSRGMRFEGAHNCPKGACIGCTTEITDPRFTGIERPTWYDYAPSCLQMSHGNEYVKLGTLPWCMNPNGHYQPCQYLSSREPQNPAIMYV